MCVADQLFVFVLCGVVATEDADWLCDGARDTAEASSYTIANTCHTAESLAGQTL